MRSAIFFCHNSETSNLIMCEVPVVGSYFWKLCFQGVPIRWPQMVPKKSQIWDCFVTKKIGIKQWNNHSNIHISYFVGVCLGAGCIFSMFLDAILDARPGHVMKSDSACHFRPFAARPLGSCPSISPHGVHYRINLAAKSCFRRSHYKPRFLNSSARASTRAPQNRAPLTNRCKKNNLCSMSVSVSCRLASICQWRAVLRGPRRSPGAIFFISRFIMRSSEAGFCCQV